MQIGFSPEKTESAVVEVTSLSLIKYRLDNALLRLQSSRVDSRQPKVIKRSGTYLVGQKMVYFTLAAIHPLGIYEVSKKNKIG